MFANVYRDWTHRRLPRFRSRPENGTRGRWQKRLL